MDPHQLPVYREKERILSVLADHPVVVIESPTGSGKTTQLPLILHEAGYANRGVIGVTQPRRIAAVSVSDYIARQLGTKIPGLVGYKMRFEDKTTFETRMKIMTDGTLLQEMKADPMLLGYSVLMVDEAHERSLNIDFILGLLKNILKVRKDFKVIISSATINGQAFADYFDGAPIIHIETQTFAVEILHEPPSVVGDEEAIVLKIGDLVGRVVEKGLPGDVLVFLPGEKMIKEATGMLAARPWARKLWVIPLYGRLSGEEQERVFLPTPEGKTKVVLSTNIAETSVTIEGITTVIDTGLAKMNFYNPKTFTSALIENPVSRAGGQQRKGRAGRTGPGTCYRLYSQEDFDARPLYTLEEIYRTDLSEVVLRMAELGIRDFESFDFLSPPGKQGIHGAVEALNLLEALESDHSLSAIGKMMVKFPLLPRHSRMIVEAILRYPEVLREVTIAATFLSTDSPFLLPQGEEIEARRAHHQFRDPLGDFVSYLRIFEQFGNALNKERFCANAYLDHKTMLELVNIQGQLEEIVSKLGIPITGGGKMDDYLCAVAKGLIQFVCIHTGRGIYRSLTAEKIGIHPGSVMFKETPPFLVAGEVVKTSRMYARSVSPIQKEWLHRIHPTLLGALLVAEKGYSSEGVQRVTPGQRPGGQSSARPAHVSATEGLRASGSPNANAEVRLGREVFPVKIEKGKNKVVIFEWDALARLLAASKATSYPELKNVKGELAIDGCTLLSGTKANKILEICRKVDPRADRLVHWPQGVTYTTSNKLKGLVPVLEDLMKVAPLKPGSTVLGFLGLLTDNRGQYWVRVDKNFTEALADSLASLEALADDAAESLDKADFKEVNGVWRRLNKLL
ncbi:MAG: ATP-dependent RNA helicase [Spirochaetales bacterium]